MEATRLALVIAVSWALTFAEAAAPDEVRDLIQLVTFALRLWLMARAQRMINLACGDAAGSRNARFTAANGVWIALGSVIWLLALASLFGLI